MITELTPEQEEQIPHFLQKWMAIGLSTEPANRDEAERWVLQAYHVAGLTKPSKIIWYDSPMAMYQAGYHSQESYWNPIWIRVRTPIWESFSNILNYRINNRLRSDLHQPIRKSAPGNIKQLIRGAIPLQDYSQEPMSGQHQCDDLAYFDYLSQVLQLTSHIENIIPTMQVSQHAGWWLPLQDVCLIAERHSYLSLDANRQPHCEDGLAIIYPDGWGVYAWHGVRVPEYVIMRPQEITPDKIMSESNIEVSRAILERYGQDNFIRDGGFSIVQSDDYGDLYRITFENGDQQIVAVHVQDASTDRDYFLYVPPHIRTAHQGVAWTFGYDNVSDYNPDKET